MTDSGANGACLIDAYSSSETELWQLLMASLWVGGWTKYVFERKWVSIFHWEWKEEGEGEPLQHCMIEK